MLTSGKFLVSFEVPSPQAYPPNKQNKVYHLTDNNPNPIYLITNPGILHIWDYTKVHIILKNYEITNSTHRNDLAPNPK